MPGDEHRDSDRRQLHDKAAPVLAMNPERWRFGYGCRLLFSQTFHSGHALASHTQAKTAFRY